MPVIHNVLNEREVCMERFVMLEGLAALIASFVLALVCFPKQIWLNYQRKSCEGLEPLLVYGACVAYGLWGLRGFLVGDHFLLWSQVPGFIFSAVGVYQIRHYRRRDELRTRGR